MFEESIEYHKSIYKNSITILYTVRNGEGYVTHRQRIPIDLENVDSVCENLQRIKAEREE